MSIKIGSKFVCGECHSEFIVIKAATADFKCCGKTLESK